MTDAYPRRLRLHGGRNTHAARPVNGGPDLITACDYRESGPQKNTLPDGADVTCRACARRLTAAATTT